MKNNVANRKKRHAGIRAKISGTKQKPRILVFRSNVHIYASLVDDSLGKTLVGVSDKNLTEKAKKTKQDKAYEVGQLLAKAAKEKKISSVVFDRAGYLYHGRVKKLAEGAREGGLKF